MEFSNQASSVEPSEDGSEHDGAEHDVEGRRPPSLLIMDSWQGVDRRYIEEGPSAEQEKQRQPGRGSIEPAVGDEQRNRGDECEADDVEGGPFSIVASVCAVGTKAERGWNLVEQYRHRNQGRRCRITAGAGSADGDPVGNGMDRQPERQGSGTGRMMDMTVTVVFSVVVMLLVHAVSEAEAFEDQHHQEPGQKCSAKQHFRYALLYCFGGVEALRHNNEQRAAKQEATANRGEEAHTPFVERARKTKRRQSTQHGQNQDGQSEQDSRHAETITRTIPTHNGFWNAWAFRIMGGG